MPEPEVAEAPFRSGFVSVTGRPNVGKSTLVNKLVDSKVSIVSNKAQTTRHNIRGILHQPGLQIVFVDTPGISKPKTALGKSLNDTARSVYSDVDINCLVIDAAAGFGRGDQFLADRMDCSSTILIVNKIDGMKPEAVAAELSKVSALDFAAYFPLSAWTGKGVTRLATYLTSQLPEGPRWYPEEMSSDLSDSQWVAELVREQLFHEMREELPHSIATRVVEWDPPLVKVEILVERDSQKGIVIGKAGEMLKQVGTRVRRQLPKGTYLELVVNVAENWQQSRTTVEEFGY